MKSRIKLPLVSICIPTYNSETTIRKTLKSILNQTYKNFKIFIVDNASTDNTVKIIKSFKKKKIKIHKFKKFLQAEENWSRCIKLSDGDYTAIYHSDDVYDKDIILKQVCFLEKNLECGAVFTEGSLIDINNKFIKKIKVPVKKKSDNFNYNYIEVFEKLAKDFNFLICPSAMVRTKIYKNYVKKFNFKNFGSSSDLDAWLRILEKYDIGIIKQNLISYTISEKQQTTQTRQFKNLPIFFKVMEKQFKKKKIRDNKFKEDFQILKSYIFLFLIIGSMQNQLNNNLNILYKKFYKTLIHTRPFFLSRKKTTIMIILFLLFITKSSKFLRKQLVQFLYFKFYKIA